MTRRAILAAMAREDAIIADLDAVAGHRVALAEYSGTDYSIKDRLMERDRVSAMPESELFGQTCRGKR